MRKCRICGKPANEVVYSNNYNSWLCDKHVDTFVMLAIHWVYMEHQAVMYVDSDEEVIEEKLSKWDDVIDAKPKKSKKSAADFLATYKSRKQKTDYSQALYNPEARGFARPRSKHLKIYPRWTGMETHNANEKHGDVNIRPKTKHNVKDFLSRRMDRKLSDMDYASKGIIWDSSIIYTKG